MLSYAGYLQGLEPGQLESEVLAAKLGQAGSVLAAVETHDQQHGLDRTARTREFCRLAPSPTLPAAALALSVAGA